MSYFFAFRKSDSYDMGVFRIMHDEMKQEHKPTRVDTKKNANASKKVLFLGLQCNSFAFCKFFLEHGCCEPHA